MELEKKAEDNTEDNYEMPLDCQCLFVAYFECFLRAYYNFFLQ